MKIKIWNCLASYVGWGEAPATVLAELDPGNQTDFERWWFSKINGAYAALQHFPIPFLPL